MKPYSLRRRLVAMIAGVMCAVFVALGAFLYAGVRDAAWRQHDETLMARARAIAAIAEHDEEGYEMDLPPAPRDEPPTYVEVRKPDGSILARTPSFPDATSLDRPFFDVLLPDGRTGRAVMITFVPRSESGTPQPLRLVLAAGIEDVERTIASVRRWFLVIGVLSLAAIAALSWWVVGRGLAPLERLGDAIERIDDKTLATPLSVDDQPTELRAVVRKLEELLGRVDRSLSRERQFTADVSHELRTPLAGLRTLVEVTALADRSTAEYKTALAEAHAIALQLGVLVENLLTFARLDAGHLPVTNSDVVLHDLVEECWKPHAALAASRKLELRNLVGDATLSIDREKLRLVLANLLANAAEYTDVGGTIEVTSTRETLLAVTDSGPALPDVERVFDRLWRGDVARTGGVHCGIGLALARSLCAAMSLSLTAENRPDGSVRFTCTRTP